MKGGGGTIASIDADGAHIAELVADETPGKPPAWSVVIRDAHGQLVWRAPTPFQPGATQGSKLAVALGRFDKVVAVGDGQRMANWDLTSHKLLGSRPGSPP